MGNFNDTEYEDMLAGLFNRFPSFQKIGAGAYKPGTANMEFFDQLAGHPHRKYKTIHIAGTNGKGSVSNMTASALAAYGLKVGLYTSPHITDFRERIRMITPSGNTEAATSESTSLQYISKEAVWEFMQKWRDTCEHLDLSFFEITTMMAFDWFAKQEVDIAVIETGLGGRMDSTNIITPILSIITNIGADHCDMLGDTLPEIAFEKAGIIKPCIDVVVGESSPETSPVFERKVLYTNLPETKFMGDRNAIMSLLRYADKIEPTMWDGHEALLSKMDLQGEYQKKNLRTVLAALDVLTERKAIPGICGHGEGIGKAVLTDAIARTAERMDFHGRWEKLSDEPYIICDIGHNAHGLRYNFAQLTSMLENEKCSSLIIVYGSVADKDIDAVIHLMPKNAVYIFTQAGNRRALDAEKIREKYLIFCKENGDIPEEIHVRTNVADAVSLAVETAGRERQNLCPPSGSKSARPLIYIGGSTYVVSEAVALIHPIFRK